MSRWCLFLWPQLFTRLAIHPHTPISASSIVTQPYILYTHTKSFLPLIHSFIHSSWLCLTPHTQACNASSNAVRSAAYSWTQMKRLCLASTHYTGKFAASFEEESYFSDKLRTCHQTAALVVRCQEMCFAAIVFNVQYTLYDFGLSQMKDNQSFPKRSSYSDRGSKMAKVSLKMYQ